MLHTKFQAPRPTSSGEKNFKYILFSNPRPHVTGPFRSQGHCLNKFGRGLLDMVHTIYQIPMLSGFREAVV